MENENCVACGDLASSLFVEGVGYFCGHVCFGRAAETRAIVPCGHCDSYVCPSPSSRPVACAAWALLEEAWGLALEHPCPSCRPRVLAAVEDAASHARYVRVADEPELMAALLAARAWCQQSIGGGL